MLRWASDSPPEPNSDPEPTATTTHADVALGAAERETDLLQRLKDVWHLGQRIYRATELFITSITPYIVVGMFLIAAFNDIARSATPRSLLFDPTPTEDNIVRSTTLPTPVFDPTTTEGNIVRSTTLPTPVYDPAPTKTTRYPWPRH
ncbi:hypothetical protein BGX29_000271 [Mortierella sp. GBA35]|nr:hypothetical protein BGX29_000271 [Mortierella sp. GBA35]